MFTTGAFLLLAAVGLYVMRANNKDLKQFYKDYPRDDDQVRSVILHIRQDLRLMVYLFGAVLIALGIIADRMH